MTEPTVREVAPKVYHIESSRRCGYAQYMLAKYGPRVFDSIHVGNGGSGRQLKL